MKKLDIYFSAGQQVASY